MADEIGLKPADRNKAILNQLADAHLKSILFVTRTDADPTRIQLIRQWGLRGHEIGNHTASHPDFDQVSLADYERELEHPNADTRPYKGAYLRHLSDRAQYYDSLSRRVLGRSVAHVLLLHHNLINALFLTDVIRMFRAKGWTLIDSEVAFNDPLYAMRPRTLPAGESLLWALAKENGVPGLRSPGEDAVYEKPILDRLHL